jgi:disulfide bond formation protein DsbB
VLIFVSLNFVTGFTLSNSLWIPSNHNINIVRLVVWFSAGYLGFQEAYDDVETWGQPIRAEKNIQAQHRWAAWLLVFLEVGISFKMREQAGNILDATVPMFVIAIWLLISAICLIYWTYLRFFYKLRIYKDGTLMSFKAKAD